VELAIPSEPPTPVPIAIKYVRPTDATWHIPED
jgi:hypothetical protein